MKAIVIAMYNDSMVQISQTNKEEVIRKRHILILLNPFSGQKLAAGNWKIAEKILEKGYMTFDLIKTERAMHAYEIISKLEPGKVSQI
jgi:diacylglycerol kinase family enzyme